MKCNVCIYAYKQDFLLKFQTTENNQFKLLKKGIQTTLPSTLALAGIGSNSGISGISGIAGMGGVTEMTGVVEVVGPNDLNGLNGLNGITGVDGVA